VPCIDETVLIPIRDAAQNSDNAPGATSIADANRHYLFLLDLAEAAEDVRDRDVADRDSLIRKIFEHGLVDRRRVRRAARLTYEESAVLEAIVPLNAPVPV
jgi:hypothetical protein